MKNLCSGLVDKQLAVSVHVICSHRYVATHSHLPVLVLHHHPPQGRVQWTVDFG